MYMERQLGYIHRGLDHAGLSFILKLHNDIRGDHPISADFQDETIFIELSRMETSNASINWLIIIFR